MRADGAVVKCRINALADQRERDPVAIASGATQLVRVACAQVRVELVQHDLARFLVAVGARAREVAVARFDFEVDSTRAARRDPKRRASLTLDPGPARVRPSEPDLRA